MVAGSNPVAPTMIEGCFSLFGESSLFLYASVKEHVGAVPEKTPLNMQLDLYFSLDNF